MESSCLKGGKNSRTWVGRAHQEGFKPGLKGEGVITRLTREEPRCGMLRLGVILTAQLKCIYANAHSEGNTQEELEAIVLQDRYDLVAIAET